MCGTYEDLQRTNERTAPFGEETASNYNDDEDGGGVEICVISPSTTPEASNAPRSTSSSRVLVVLQYESVSSFGNLDGANGKD